mmetsp:Transcript_26101/g.29226  ORF Transcript_26101/g.29226 Transcript_26101/m.29226 type:complete len:80 (-) Transcript_26101:122-361(-)
MMTMMTLLSILCGNAILILTIDYLILGMPGTDALNTSSSSSSIYNRVTTNTICVVLVPCQLYLLLCHLCCFCFGYFCCC